MMRINLFCIIYRRLNNSDGSTNTTYRFSANSSRNQTTQFEDKIKKMKLVLIFLTIGLSNGLRNYREIQLTRCIYFRRYVKIYCFDRLIDNDGMYTTIKNE